MRRAHYAILGLLLASHPLFGQCQADVSGRVINEEGKPVAGAQVSFPGKEARGILALGYYPTDKSGSFHAVLSLSAPGLYWVLAKKLDSGYPNMNAAFYDNHKPPLVMLHCGAKVSGIVVNLGSKSAYITQIKVVDATTGDPIENASITFRRVKPPFRGFSPTVFSITSSATLMPTGSNYLGFPIPSNADISYAISAPGYETSQPQIIRLAPAKTAEISVRLQRSSPVSGKLP